MKKTIILLFALSLSITATAQQAYKTTNITFAKYKGTTVTTSDSAVVLNAHADSTTWMNNMDSTGSRGFYAAFQVVGSTDETAKIEIQFGIKDPVAGSYKVMEHAAFSYVIDSLYDSGGATGDLVSRNPTGFPLWHRVKSFPGSTVHRFIITHGTVTETGTAYLYGKEMGPQL